jgi:hypothetical protein
MSHYKAPTPAPGDTIRSVIPLPVDDEDDGAIPEIVIRTNAEQTPSRNNQPRQGLGVCGGAKTRLDER